MLVSKYSEHLPLHRLAQVMARHGLSVERSTLAEWVGRAAFHLAPVVDRMTERLKRSGKLFMDEATAPVFDPGHGKAKTGYLWVMLRDDRPCAETIRQGSSSPTPRAAAGPMRSGCWKGSGASSSSTPVAATTGCPRTGANVGLRSGWLIAGPTPAARSSWPRPRRDRRSPRSPGAHPDALRH